MRWPPAGRYRHGGLVGGAELDPVRVKALAVGPVAAAFSKQNVFVVRNEAVARAHRKSAVFTELIGAVIDYLAKLSAPWFVFIDCDPETVPLYERLGFRCHAPHFLYPRGGVDVPTYLVVHDLNYLASIRSRVLPVLLQRGQAHVPAAARFFREMVEGPVEADIPATDAPIDPHGTMDTAPPLREMPLFKGVGNPDIETFLDDAARVEFHAGDQIIDAPARGIAVYLPRAGFVHVVKTSPMGRKTIVTTLGPGDLLGEMSMLLGEGRTADVVALSNGEMIRIRPQQFLAAKGVDAAVLARINLNLAAILARRLKATTNLVA
ncbi:MAG: cyclic nucleotide-binding domain-containing protein [Alphaproteobacteria bacterium]|nr:cyclic nucleotide-binding domain-containing protein [Alphaproteobacteria bacterium]